MPRKTAPSIPANKLAVIGVARRQLALAEEDYRSILAIYAGVDSSTKLDQAGFTAVMERFAQLGFRSTSRRRPIEARTGMASPGQTSLMRHLWAECTGGTGTDASLGKWLERQFGVSSVRFVTAQQAQKVIGGLKGMKARREHSAAA
jgi:hypothetical protein